ncbi:trypsin-like peptidase domain-containing protein [Marinagarivorans algicola]|uniref:trypsin-like peptidase domain-containing protein n=1 Tax=Marinagarivorans algicola TaxID=1513270 RepID=UPI0009E73BC7|nr:trypsin-like peptidase domain-containing protein [Marinagarivorans algicola]
MVAPQISVQDGRATFVHRPSQNTAPASYAQAVQHAAHAVVNIYTRKKFTNERRPLFNDPLFRHFFNNADSSRQERMQSALGSGVIVTQSGYLLTNNHVIQGADEIVVQLQDGRDAQADLIGIDKENDLAVLKIALDQLTAISINERPLMVGDVVLAVGNPFGMGQTVTQGIISAVGRYGLGINTFENFIQTDAAINPGNSGGALIDAYGNLVGINTAMLDRIGENNLNGIGLAIPAETALQSLSDIIEFGRVVRGWLGVTAQPITPQLASRYRLPSPHGLLVTGVYKNGPAHIAGLTPGDIIIKVNDQKVNNGLSGSLRSMQEVKESRPGEEVKLEVYRNNTPLTITAVLSINPNSSE